jgi:hypothetical protein
MLSHNISLILGVTDRCSGFFLDKDRPPKIVVHPGCRLQLRSFWRSIVIPRKSNPAQLFSFVGWDWVTLWIIPSNRTHQPTWTWECHELCHTISISNGLCIFFYFFRWLVLSHFQIGWLQPGPMEPLSVHSISASGLIWPRDKKEKR